MHTTSLALVAALVAGVAASPASAKPKKHKKPITKTYTASAPAPDPTNYAMQGYSVCAQNVPQSFDIKEFTAPAPGKLKVEMHGFTGDWDLLLMDSEQAEMTQSGSSDLGSPTADASESMTYKIKKAKKKYSIVACNWAGGPSATVKYTFTYA